MSSIKGIRYATASRFAKPVIASELNTDILVCPQKESRLGGVMGPMDTSNPFSEDCLRLSIYIPDNIEEGETLPVMVWFCGGKYVTGSGLFARYDASRISNEGQLITVCVSYRVGVLGWLYQPESGSVNLGLQDQICALEWIHQNIGAYGGDNERITLCGQSAGAQSVACILSTIKKPLFNKAILFSAPLGISIRKKQGNRFRKIFLRKCPDYLNAGFDALLSAQAESIRVSGYMMALGPVGVDQMPDKHLCPGLEEVLVTWQKDDASPFVAGKPMSRLLEPLATAWLFKSPSRHFAKLLEKRGVKVTTREFRWRHKENGIFGACHSLELPLLFGEWENWNPADMLNGVSQGEYEAQGKKLRAEIAAFVTSNPHGKHRK